MKMLQNDCDFICLDGRTTSPTGMRVNGNGRIIIPHEDYKRLNHDSNITKEEYYCLGLHLM